MGTRLGFRPRPLNNNAQLSIVRDLAELDNAEGLLPAETPDVAKAAAEAQSSAQAQASAAHGKPKPKEIPVPEVREVPSYHRDYLPIFEAPNTYIRSQRGAPAVDDEYVEYDLDNEDEDWLASYDQGQHRLSAERFERMLWRLEVACAEANDRVFSTAAGGAPPERLSATQAAVTDNLPKADAIELLRQKVGGRDAVLEAVYNYWVSRRQRKAKPLLRRLHAPTPVSDSNPFNVFRPREKLNRPQTRRRRENNEECLEKLKQIRLNLKKGMELCDWLRKRETRKRDIVTVEVESQRLQIRLRLEPKHLHEAIEAETLKKLKARLQAAEARDAAAIAASDPEQRAKKRKKVEAIEPTILQRCRGELLAALPPPPMQPDLELLFSHQLTADELHALERAGMQLPPDLDVATCRMRVGRGGRLIFDRLDPITYEPITSDSTRPHPQPTHQHPQAIIDELFPEYVKAVLQPLVAEAAPLAALPTKPKSHNAATSAAGLPTAAANGPLRATNTNSQLPSSTNQPSTAELKPPTPKAPDNGMAVHASGLPPAVRKWPADGVGTNAAVAAAAAAAGQVAMGLKRGPGRPPKAGSKDVD